jgi:hypothetical protein
MTISSPITAVVPTAQPVERTLSIRNAVDLAQPVLVCGVGRSGTSLLHSMLNAHPALAFPPETHFFRRYVVPRRTRARLESGAVEAFADVLSADHDFLRAGVTPSAALEGERDGALDLARVFRRILGNNAARQGKHRVGDKDPRNIDHLATLAVTFPHGYLLHVIRDPREVLLSRIRAAWSSGRPWWQHALLVEDQLRRGRALGVRLFGARYMEVHYEALVAAPEATLRAIARQVGIEYSAAMLEFRASAASLVHPRESSWKRETLGPLLADNIAKWRSGLAPSQIQFVERVSREAFDRAGYERSVGSDVAEQEGETRRARSMLASFGPMLGLVSRGAFALRRTLEARA